MRAQVEWTRGGAVESVHRVRIAVCDVEGGLVSWAGDPEALTFYRSSAKPFQACPLVDDDVVDTLELTQEELAVCIGSHNGEPRHVSAVLMLLEKAGLGPEALRCGAHPPLDNDSALELARAGASPQAVHHQCSGKHAGMLALAVVNGWPTEGYDLADHPVQQRMLGEIAKWTNLAPEALRLATEECGVTSFAVRLRDIATSYARLAKAASEQRPAASKVVGCMTLYPGYVAGRGRPGTAVTEVAGSRLFVKSGAEGVFGVGILERGLGVVVKVEDGAQRAAAPALLATLAELDVITSSELDQLARFARPTVRNTRGDVVGEVRTTLELATPGNP